MDFESKCNTLEESLSIVIEKEELLWIYRETLIQVVLLDELDHLVTRKQTVLYTIFE